jgi:hypothetical protein
MRPDIGTHRLSVYLSGRGAYAWSVNQTWANENANIVNTWDGKTSYSQWTGGQGRKLSLIPDWAGPVSPAVTAGRQTDRLGRSSLFSRV